MKQTLLIICACLALAIALPHPHPRIPKETTPPHSIKNNTQNMATNAIKAGSALLERLLPNHTGNFIIEWIPQENHRDVFELENRENKIVIRGNTGVAIASGLHWYLKNSCGCHVSLHDHRLQIPHLLPVLTKKIRVVTPFKYRNFFNYCTFSYTMAWWDWPQWERMIDYLALNGVNMPLAIIGQEGVWLEVYRELGLTDSQILTFFVGPAYLPWGWMGNIDGLGGPLSLCWIQRRVELQQKILARERELGMTPILQGFTGHVPLALKEVYPRTQLHRTTNWANMHGTWFLDPKDPMFAKIGQLFMRHQTRLFGSDHLYNADCFNEINPPSDSPGFIRQISQSVFHTMKSADPEAIWVFQGWFFYWQADFWKHPQARAFMEPVPHKSMIGLDLYAEAHPVWKSTNGFYGKPWIWNVLLYSSQKVNMSGYLDIMQRNLAEAMSRNPGKRLQGIGMMMEGLDYNPVVQEFVMEKTWNPGIVDLKQWISAYARRRYGSNDPRLQQAWIYLLEGPYNRNMINGYESLICSIPWLSRSHTKSPDQFATGYDPLKIVDACELLLACSDDLQHLPNYRFDVVHVTREMMSNLALYLNQRITQAYIDKDPKTLALYSLALLQLIRDMDELLATNPHFLLGTWLNQAKQWATTPEEAKLLETNARAIITMWDPSPKSILRDYASKEWSGLLTGFYLPRWQLFLNHLAQSLEKNEPFNRRQYLQELKEIELQWLQKQDSYPDIPHGDSLEVAKIMYKKYVRYYRPSIENE